MRRDDLGKQWVHTDEVEAAYGWSRTRPEDMPRSLRNLLAARLTCDHESADSTKTSCLRVVDHRGPHVGLDEYNIPAVWKS